MCARVQLSTISWRRTDLWNPTVLIMVYVWETSNLPSLRLPHPLGCARTRRTHKNTRTHWSLKGTFTLPNPPPAISYVLWCLSIGEMNHFIYHRHFYGMYITPLASAQYVFYTYSSASTPARCPMWPPSSLCLVSIRPQWILLQRSLALLTAGQKAREMRSQVERGLSVGHVTEWKGESVVQWRGE